MSQSIHDSLPVVVIGAGPVGLAAAAHLLQRGIDPLVLEAGDAAGANLLDYGHVQLFSPWRYNLDAAMTALLSRHGWHQPDLEELPLARDIVEKVLKPFAALPEVKRFICFRHRVHSITREGYDKVKSEGREKAPFILQVATPEGITAIRARAILDASGTWSTPNPLGASGLPAIGEEEARDRIHYGIPDVLGPARSRYSGKRVMVVGAGHSAANALLALAELSNQGGDTRIIWAVRGKSVVRAFGGGDADALPARGRLGTELRRLQEAGKLKLLTDFRVSAISRRGDTLTIHALGSDGSKKHETEVDEVICATGQRPNLKIASELRLKLDPWLESSEALGTFIDPNVHSCGTVRPHGHRELAHPEVGYYSIGVKSYGRAPTFLMTTGFEQARSVVAAVAGDLEAADRVELLLPETGVCSSNLGDDGGSCCGVETPTLVAIDDPVREAAQAGCRSGRNTLRQIPIKANSCCS